MPCTNGPKEKLLLHAANGGFEPISPNVAHIINICSRTKATAIGEHLLTAPENQITTAFDVFALR